jgi:hypothetical protein
MVVTCSAVAEQKGAEFWVQADTYPMVSRVEGRCAPIPDRFGQVDLPGETPLTLIFSSHDVEHNNALALKQYLDGKLHSGVRDGSRGVARNTAA